MLLHSTDRYRVLRVRHIERELTPPGRDGVGRVERSTQQMSAVTQATTLPSTEPLAI